MRGITVARIARHIVAHADWSIDPRKRWVAIARRDAAVWRLAAPAPVGDVATFLARLRRAADGGAVALGVDLPVGLPRAYAADLPERDFLHFLTTTATRPDFFQVCATLAEVGPGRPFYPARGVAGMTRAAHAAALGWMALPPCRAPATAPLRNVRPARRCSGRSAPTSRARRRSPPGSTMLLPALASGDDVRIWPFAGAVPGAAGTRRRGAGGDLSGRGAAPSRHPAERQQAPAGGPGGGREPVARRHGGAGRCLPDPGLQQAIADGFGRDAAGEDRFDCVLGVLCVLNVLAGNRPDTAPADPWISRWEGWVLGQTALPGWPPGRGQKERARHSRTRLRLFSVTPIRLHDFG